MPCTNWTPQVPLGFQQADDILIGQENILLDLRSAPPAQASGATALQVAQGIAICKQSCKWRDHQEGI